MQRRKLTHHREYQSYWKLRSASIFAKIQVENTLGMQQTDGIDMIRVLQYLFMMSQEK